MITEVQLNVIKSDRSGHELLKSYAPPKGEDRTVTLRHAHDLLVTWLNVEYPDQWVYAYGDIEQDDFSGQFQWKEGGLGTYVPASVHYTDPEEEEARRRAEEACHAEEARIAAEVQAKVDALPPMRFVDAAGEGRWNQAVALNDDPYGGGVIKYAERWARLMQAQIDAGLPVTMTEIERQSRVWEAINQVADPTSHEADTDGITGFMYGAAVSTLAQTWIYGNELRRWHNRQYGVEEDKAQGGVVNPALLTVNVSE